MTSGRLLFVGARQSREIPLSKIISMDSVDRGIAIAATGHQKTEYFLGTEVLQISEKLTPDLTPNADPVTVTWHLRGEELRKVVQGLLAPSIPAT